MKFKKDTVASNARADDSEPDVAPKISSRSPMPCSIFCSSNFTTPQQVSTSNPHQGMWRVGRPQPPPLVWYFTPISPDNDVAPVMLAASASC